MARYAVLSGRVDAEIIRDLPLRKYWKYIKARKREYISPGQESGGSEHAIILPIWVGGRFRPVRVRLIGGEAELLSGMDIIGKLRIAADFGKRNFCILGVVSGKRWLASVETMGSSSSPNCARLYKIGRILRGNENCDLDVIAAQADSEEISGV